jgi:hypothetical protein
VGCVRSRQSLSSRAIRVERRPLVKGTHARLATEEPLFAVEESTRCGGAADAGATYGADDVASGVVVLTIVGEVLVHRFFSLKFAGS